MQFHVNRQDGRECLYYHGHLHSKIVLQESWQLLKIKRGYQDEYRDPPVAEMDHYFLTLVSGFRSSSPNVFLLLNLQGLLNHHFRLSKLPWSVLLVQ